MKRVIKALSLKSDGDTAADTRELVVIATDGSEDRDLERFDTATLLLPLKDGSTIAAAKLTGDEELDVTAFINHERDVLDIIGSVSSARLNDEGQLEMTIKLADTDDADTVYALAKGGHLGNNISVTYDMAEVDERDGVFYGATVLEVSVVWRGSNKHARVLSVKSDKGGDMSTETKTPAEVAEALEAARTSLSEAEAAIEAAQNANEDGQDKPDEGGDKPAEQPANDDNNEEEKMNVAKAMTETTKSATAPKAVTVANSNSGYLSSKQATKDWFATMGAHHSDGVAAIKAWRNSLNNKGISGDDFMPIEIANVIFDSFTNPAGVLSTVSRVNSVKQMFVNALNGSGDTARAAGHTKGDDKRDQELTNIRRNVLCRMIYKRLALDYMDAWSVPELMTERLTELTKQLVNEIERAIVIGDGRTAPSDSTAADYRVFVDEEGIRSMKSDVASSTTDSSFSSLVADIYTPATTDTNIYDKILGAKALLKADGKTVLVAKKSAITDLYRAKNTSGGYLIQPSASLEATLAVDKVLQPSWMDEDADYDAYLYVDQSYKLIGDANPTQRPWFDGVKNQDNLLLEQPLGGSATGYKSVVGIKVATSE